MNNHKQNKPRWVQESTAEQNDTNNSYYPLTDIRDGEDRERGWWHYSRIVQDVTREIEHNELSENPIVCLPQK